jgi:hypothetical protein
VFLRTVQIRDAPQESPLGRFALPSPVDYDSRLHIMPTAPLACDGCGQPASPEHIARRLQRLEWTSRYRPVHMATLLLGGFSPLADADFLYSGKFEGEAARLVDAVGISSAGKPPETVLSEFQRGGFFLTHLLECPLESGQAGPLVCESLLANRISSVMTRVRRSLKPKRVILISESLAPVAARLSSAELGCAVILDGSQPFGLDSLDVTQAVKHLRSALAAPIAAK